MKINITGSAEGLYDFIKKSYEKQTNISQVMDFFDSSLEDSLMPKKKIWSYVNEDLNKPFAFCYAGPQGDEGLRIKLAQRYFNNTKLADKFMVTSGAQEALMVIIKYLNATSKQKIIVGVEEFSYIGFNHILVEQKNKIKYLKLTNEGLDINLLEKEIKNGLNLIYLIPDIQNPTGVVYSKKNRREIVNLQKKYNFWLILDLSYRDLFFKKEDTPSLSMFKHPQIFFIGSFSKTIFPALRIGWLYTPIMNNGLLLNRRSIDIFQPTFLQLATTKYLNNDLDNHLNHIRSILEYKKNLMIKELIRNGFGDFYEWNDVSGGFYLWLKRKDGKSCLSEINNWSDKGIIVASGVFFNPKKGANYIRLCFARLTADQIINALNRITFHKKIKKINSSNFFSRIIINSKIFLKKINDEF